MNDIELVIKIPKKTYEQLKFLNKQGFGTVIDELVVIGTPLPKGHGRLIDADAYRKEMLDSREFDFFKRLDMQPTIVEADKENKE